MKTLTLLFAQLFFLGFCLLSLPLLADEGFALQYHQEYGFDDVQEDEAFGITIVSDLQYCDGFYCRIGLGFSDIRSNQALNNKGDNRVTPVYFMFHITGNYFIAPFVELGADLAALLLEDEYKNYGSTYISAGLNFAPTSRFSINAYAKQYRIGESFDRHHNEHYEDEHAPDNRERVNMMGASLTVFFD